MPLSSIEKKRNERGFIVDVSVLLADVSVQNKAIILAFDLVTLTGYNKQYAPVGTSTHHRTSRSGKI